MISRRLVSLASLVLVTTAFAALPACGGIALSAVEGTPPADDAGTPPSSPTPTPATPPSPGAASCSTSADCGAGESCAWSTGQDWCTALVAPGTCVRLVELGCNALTLEVGCGCGGVDVSWTGGCSGLPDGYAPEPLAHAGSCEQPGGPPVEVDAGPPVTFDAAPPVTFDAGLPITEDAAAPPVTVDAGDPTPCSPDNECPAGEFCGYSDFGSCGAPPQCFPFGAMGLCASIRAACGCDGKTIGIPACGTATTQPVAYVGACVDADGGF
jgi:hypothetical protein